VTGWTADEWASSSPPEKPRQRFPKTPSRGFRVFGDKLPNERSNLGEAPLLAARGKHLHPIDAGCDLGLNLPRDLERSFRQTLGRREIAVQNRPHRTGAG
jgi:hypothetical protein